MKDFLMVIMASGVVRGRVRTTTTTTTTTTSTESRNMAAILQCFGIFGGICSGKLENVTCDNQPGQYHFNTLKLQGFHVFAIKNFLVLFLYCCVFRLTETCDTDK